jgi:tetratricopeptide (TPR) repeat protein
MDCRPRLIDYRTGAVLILLAATLLGLPACRRKATFEENYSGALENIKRGKYQLAQIQLRQAYIQSPNNIETRYQLAMVQLKLQEDNSAYSLLREAEEKDHHQSSVSVPIRIELAKLFIAAKMYEQAQQRLIWVLQKEPRNRDALDMLAKALLYMAQPEAAKEQIDMLLAEDPQNLDGRTLDMALHLAAHEAQQAERSLQEEVTLTKRSTDSLMTLARYYRLVGAPAKAIALFTEVAQREPQSVPVRMQLGWTYVQAGDRASAEKTFRDMAQITPANRTATGALASYYVKTADWPKATTELERLVKQNPEEQSRDLLAAVYYKGGRRADAQKLAQQLIQENSEDANAHLLNGLFHLDAREFQRAGAEFDQVIHFRSDSAPAQYLLALASFGAGKPQVAVQQMEHALQLNKELLPARLWLMDYHLKRKAKEVVLNLARETPERQLSTPGIVVMSALCSPEDELSPEQQTSLQNALLDQPLLILNYANQGMPALLLKYGGPLRKQLEATVKKYPEFRPAETVLLAVWEAQGKQDQAMAQVQKQVAAHPNSPPDLLTLAQLQIRRGDLTAARATLGKAAAIQPDNADVMVRIAGVEADMGHLDAALTQLEGLTKRYPKSSVAWSFKGIVHQQRGEAKEARALYEEALRLDSNNAVAANNLAVLVDPNQGLELARKAHALNPAIPEFSDTLGWIEYSLGHYPEALEALGDAVRIKPDDAIIRYHLGMAQSHSGRDKEALASLEAAQRLNPKLPEGRDLAAELAALRSRTARSGAVR